MDTTYLPSIQECVSQAFDPNPEFLAELLQAKVCVGGIVATIEQLEALRFCNIINSSLVLTINDATADFTSLHDIAAIQGLFF